MTVSLEKDIAIDLLEFKLRHIRELLEEILKTWKENDAERFLVKTRSGELEEAEMDAISVEQLLIDIDKYQKLLENVD